MMVLKKDAFDYPDVEDGVLVAVVRKLSVEAPAPRAVAVIRRTDPVRLGA